MNSIHARFKEVRLTFHMSQEEFGKMLGLSKSGISNMESGARAIRDSYIKTLCSSSGISERWLRTGIGSMFLKDEVSDFEIFNSFLNTLDYRIEVSSSKNGEDNIITITNGDISANFTVKEFDKFHEEIKKAINFQIWQKRIKE